VEDRRHIGAYSILITSGRKSPGEGGEKGKRVFFIDRFLFHFFFRKDSLGTQYQEREGEPLVHGGGENRNTRDMARCFAEKGLLLGPTPGRGREGLFGPDKFSFSITLNWREK